MKTNLFLTLVPTVRQLFQNQSCHSYTHRENFESLACLKRAARAWFLNQHTTRQMREGNSSRHCIRHCTEILWPPATVPVPFQQQNSALSGFQTPALSSTPAKGNTHFSSCLISLLQQGLACHVSEAVGTLAVYDECPHCLNSSCCGLRVWPCLM